jgi:hypothetical protein
MPDFIVLQAPPPVFTAATPKAAIAQALAQLPQFSAADGSFSITLWVASATGAAGQTVQATVTVTASRSLAIDILP